MTMEKPSLPKPELGAGGLNIVRKLDLVITSTQQEISLLLELESQAASGINEDELVTVFDAKFSKLPQFYNGNNEAKKYVTSLLQQYRTDASTFVKKMEYLNEFLKKTEKDAAALDAKYTINKPEEVMVELGSVKDFEDSTLSHN